MILIRVTLDDGTVLEEEFPTHKALGEFLLELPNLKWYEFVFPEQATEEDT